MTGLESQEGRLPLEDAARLLSGADLSSSHGLPEHGVPSLIMSDGPHGLAMNLPDFAGKVPATCFPSPGALASTWDVDLVARIGRAIGREARAAGAHLLLGPSVNIRRSPLAGRGFEYYSEDPLVSGLIGAAFVTGVQSAGVGACVKHYAVNSQETDRMRVSAELSESALREIYLPAFEHIVTTARPAAVMASYNAVNGILVSQHRELLTEILRDEWGFEGAVVSDWGAVDDRVAAVQAGLDLEMPGAGEAAPAALVYAVREGRLEEEAVRRAARRMVHLAHTWAGPAAHASDDTTVDRDAHHDLAAEAARAAMVLLRNDAAVLPLSRSGDRPLLVVGELARTPRIQGGGSSAVNACLIDDPVAELAARTPRPVLHEPGYSSEGDCDADVLLASAVAAAASAHDVVLVVGPPPEADTEGRDRDGLELPAAQLRLLEALVEANPRTVVVVNGGGVVAGAEWHLHAAALLAGWLPGQAGGAAWADVLLGIASPSGRLTETMPLSVSDTPAAPGFPGTGGRAFHGEGVLVGYRGYDRLERAVAFPFGHGLSYTTFGYGDLVVRDPAGADGAYGVTSVDFTLTNTGDRPGAEVWQVYVESAEGLERRPARALAAFGKVVLEPGESRRVEATLPWRAFASWDDRWSGWCVAGGRHAVAVGASSRDLRLRAPTMRAALAPPRVLDTGCTLSEWLDDPMHGPLLRGAVQDADASGATTAFLTNPGVLAMISDLPVHRLFDDPANVLSEELLGRVLASASERRSG